MSSTQEKPNTKRILEGLKDFQKQTVDYVFSRLYEDKDAVNRFLITDEVGLGKTLVARGVIAKAVEYIWEDKDRIDILYICANRDIARQNINRLNITGKREIEILTRMTLLPLHVDDLKDNKINFITLTPTTSFDLRSREGLAYERALIYHILREYWGFGNLDGPKNLLQGLSGRESWRSLIRNFDTSEIEKSLAKAYIKSLQKHKDIRMKFDDLVKHSSYHGEEKREKQRELIGNLRRILAESCVEVLKPDIVILDEFQRFKKLIDGNDEMALLARSLFDYPNCRVVLLSATPYKMYTMHHEKEDDDHYKDFIRTVDFLFNSKDKTDIFKEDLVHYRKELFNINSSGTLGLKQSKEVIERKLRKVMVRTERISATIDRDAMIKESIDLGNITSQDLNSFVLIDNLAKNLKTSDTVEYWKSAPYLINFMDQHGYQIKNKFVECIKNGRKCSEFIEILDEKKDNLLEWKTINSYKKVDPNNSKLRTLITNVIEAGAWKLLWIPPSLPYYSVEKSPFNDQALKGFTKALVFSSWQVVPKVISILTSYEAERLMMSSFKSNFDYSERNRKLKPLLNFSFSKNRLTGMSNIPLIYPCMTLAWKIDPLVTCVDLKNKGMLPDYALVFKAINEQICDIIRHILQKYEKPSDQSDERWYWAALALLDSHYYYGPVGKWLENDKEGLSWKNMVQSRKGDDPDTHFSEHVKKFYEYFENINDMGSIPDDLINVLTKVALASPAVVGLRSMLRFYQNAETNHLMAGAAKIGLGFRSLFNNPDSISIIRGQQNIEESRYWESVLDYCISGNFQSVMDEYLHILNDSLGLIDASANEAVKELSNEIYDALTLRTVNLDFDEIKIQSTTNNIKLDFHRPRCKFALRFGDAKNDEDGGETRSDQVRKAFNSPFSPFILATTSIGQEGLDFHQYCHEIYHWNLPSNPVDLEQREGRIHRYKGHVIRRNIAHEFNLASLAGKIDKLEDPWWILFSLSINKRASDQNDMIPFWIFEPKGGYKIIRHIPALPLSRELQHLEDLKRTLVAYRMVFGQPRQEDLVNYLQLRLKQDITPEDLLKFRIDLSPRRK